MTEPRKLRVFLCHSSQDKPTVRELYQRLLAEEWIDPWLDEEKLLPGQDWDMEIEKAVEAADVVIVCASSRSVTKEGYIQRELKFTLDIALEKPEGTIFIIPLRLDVCELPRRISSLQYEDYFPFPDKREAYQRLLKALKIRFDSIPIEQENTLDGIMKIEAFPIISSICGGLIGLISYYLPWLLPKPNSVFNHSCTGHELTSTEAWCYWLGSPLLYLIPLIFLSAILQALLVSWRYNKKLGYRLIDISIFGLIILFSHLWKDISRLLPLLPGFVGTLLALVLILVGGIYQSIYELPYNRTSISTFWSQRSLIYLILFVFFSFIIFAIQST